MWPESTYCGRAEGGTETGRRVAARENGRGLTPGLTKNHKCTGRLGRDSSGHSAYTRRVAGCVCVGRECVHGPAFLSSSGVETRSCGGGCVCVSVCVASRVPPSRREQTQAVCVCVCLRMRALTCAVLAEGGKAKTTQLGRHLVPGL